MFVFTPLMWNSYSALCIFWTACRYVLPLQMTCVIGRRGSAAFDTKASLYIFVPERHSQPPYPVFCLREMGLYRQIENYSASCLHLLLELTTVRWQ